MKQIVTIGADGSVSGLQHKPGSGLDLRKMGAASIRRISEILHSDEHQAWYVSVMDQEVIITFTGEDSDAMELTLGRWREATHTQYPEDIGIESMGTPGAPGCIHAGTLLFDNYDVAVKAEIAFLDALRQRGIFERLT